MRRLIWGFASRTYHIVGNLIIWLIYLSKAITCMKLFLYKQKLLFSKETDTFGHIVVWTIYTSHIDHFTPQHTAFKKSAVCLLVFLELRIIVVYAHATVFFSKVHSACHNIANGNKQEVTLKDAADCSNLSCMLWSKVVHVRCISCSYNNVAIGIRRLEKTHLFSCN